MRISFSKHRECFPPRKLAHAPRMPRSEALTPAIAAMPHSEDLTPVLIEGLTPATPATAATPRSEALTPVLPAATPHSEGLTPATAAILVGSRTR